MSAPEDHFEPKDYPQHMRHKPAITPDFELTPGAKTIAEHWAAALASASADIVAAMMHEDLTETQANMAIANLYVSIAARIACATARKLLNRDPDIGKWRTVCDDAFLRAEQQVTP